MNQGMEEEAVSAGSASRSYVIRDLRLSKGMKENQLIKLGYSEIYERRRQKSLNAELFLF